jgi:hypothetical protein
MSYDLFFRAHKDLAAQDVADAIEQLRAISAEIGGEFQTHGARLGTRGDLVASISLGFDPWSPVSDRQACALQRLKRLSREAGLMISDPQTGEALMPDGFPIAPVESSRDAFTLVGRQLRTFLEPHGFQDVGNLRFSRSLPDLYQHIIARLRPPTGDTLGRLFIEAGWTILEDCPGALSSGEVDTFTHLEPLQQILGRDFRLEWRVPEDLIPLLSQLQGAFDSAILPWLAKRSTIEELLKLYCQDSTLEGSGLYFGSEPRNHWLLAQIYRSRGDRSAELQMLRRFLVQASPTTPATPWLLSLVAQAEERVEELDS